MKKIIFCLVLLTPLLLYSQGKITISGTIEKGIADSIELIIDKNYLPQKLIKNKIPVKQNQFSFELQLDRNLPAAISCGIQTAKIYLEPEDKIEIKFNADSLSKTLVFSGKGAVNNQFLKKFSERFKNDFTVSIMEESMKSMTADQFEMMIFDNRKKQKDFYNSYPEKGLFSDKFKKYIENQIKYNYLDLLISYPIVNANTSTAILTVNPLPAVMLDVLDKKTVSDEEAMICEPYRNFLTYFVIYYASELNKFNKYKDFTLSAEKKYTVAKENLKGSPFLYYLTNFLLDMGEKINPETVKRFYDEMVKEDKTGVYAGAVKDKLGKWMKTKLPKNTEENSEAASSELKLTGLNGKEISLSHYKGKVVYVDFWASWCGPCRQQFPFSKELHEKLTAKQKKDVVFLYISIDNTEEIWKKAINDLQLGGEHALSQGGWSSPASKYFQLSSIPRYLLIDKKGNIVDQNAKRPGEEGTLEDILNLLK